MDEISNNVDSMHCGTNAVLMDDFDILMLDLLGLD
jgi:hypothetical protein